MEKLRIVKIADEFMGYVGNKEFRASTRQGVINDWMAQHVIIEDEPIRDYTEILSRIEYIMKARPSKCLTDIFCVHPDMHEDDFDWTDDNSYLSYIEHESGITPYVPKAVKECYHEELVDVLEALGFNSHCSFEVDAYVPEKADAYWILKMQDRHYYIASLSRHDDYERIKINSRSPLAAVAHAPIFGEYHNPEVAVRANLAAQLLLHQNVGEVNYTLKGDEK